MKTMSSSEDTDAGSRMHVLDWLDSSQFLSSLRDFIAPIGFTVLDEAKRQPKGRSDYRESELVGRNEPFLTQQQQSGLRSWWLVFAHGVKLPTWDLVVAATDVSSRPSLILVEAKAHATELDPSGKILIQRKTEEERKRSLANHERIGSAISEATSALQLVEPEISLSRDYCYQFANRIAFAWKLASMGVPVALIYLGFIGDSRIISGIDDCFSDAIEWRKSFTEHTARCFPPRMYDREINCGAAAFWLLVRDLCVLRQSPPISQRRDLKTQTQRAY